MLPSAVRLYESCVALDESVAERAASAAERYSLSLSAWLSAAAGRALVVEDGLAAVQAREDEHGNLTDEELAWADSILDGTAGRVAS